jgi:protein-tyrosine-phosphatase
MRFTFVCIQNADRSQMATAFAKQERRRRGVEDEVEIVTGGTDPAESLHEEVITVMDEAGFDLRDVTPRRITPEELGECDYVAAMGCTADGVCPATWSEASRDWDLEDPHGKELDTVREIRETVEQRVRELFDEGLEGAAEHAAE